MTLVKSAQGKESDVAEQCLQLQRELALQRQNLLLQWCPNAGLEGERAQRHFPRSATMRFLARPNNAALLIQLAKWQLRRHYPAAFACTQTLRAVLSGV